MLVFAVWLWLYVFHGCYYMLGRYVLAAETTFLGIFDGELMNIVIWGWEPE